MNNTAVKISDLSVKVGEFTLDKVNLEIPKGTILGIVGKNGAGKTTLIKAIAGIYEKSGQILINDYTINHDEVNYLRQLGIIPDYNWLSPVLNARKFAKKLSTIYPQFDEDFYFKNLAKLEVPLDIKYNKLSSGTQRKLGLIVVMSLKPNVLILDEVSANVDPISKREILNLLQTYILDETKTIIYATHQTDELDRIADYVLCLDNGKVKFFDDKESLTENHSIIRVDEEQFKKIDPKDIISYSKTTFGYSVLLKGSNSEKKQQVTIEDLIYGYCGGGVK